MPALSSSGSCPSRCPRTHGCCSPTDSSCTPRICYSPSLRTVICKKIRRKELEASPRYVDSLSMLGETITLHPVKDLIERAMLSSLEIEHPVYDCLYVACAEETESRLMTADQKLVNKVSGRSLDLDIDFIGADGFADEVTAAATALVIRKEMVVQLIEAHDRLAETREIGSRCPPRRSQTLRHRDIRRCRVLFRLRRLPASCGAVPGTR